MGQTTRPLPTSNTTAAGCQPWCASRADGTPHPEDTACRTRPTYTCCGAILTTYTPDEGFNVWVDNPSDEMTLANAEQLGHALLAQVAAVSAEQTTEAATE